MEELYEANMTKIMTVFMLTLFFLSFTGAATSTLNEVKVITVAGDGSGNYTVTGKTIKYRLTKLLQLLQKIPVQLYNSKDHSSIIISDTILLGSNAILEGGPGVTLKLAKGLKAWGGPGTSYVSRKAMFMIKKQFRKKCYNKKLNF
jgi:hypothetical protein